MRQRFSLALTLLTVVSVLAGTAAAGPASATPTGPATTGDEGGNPLLRDVLESTGRGFAAASNAVRNARERQAAYADELRRIEEQLDSLGPEVGEVAVSAYRIGRIGPISALLASAGPDEFMERAEGLDLIAQRDNSKLRKLREARDQASRAKAAADAALAEEQRQLAVMAKQREAAERALSLVGGASTEGFVNTSSPVASPAPRNRDGSWPAQSCNRGDPTTRGCLTPRALHALNETRRLGFTRHVSCYRSGGPFEHPKGRACDFSAEPGGFGGDAKGGDRTYGNNLAAFLVRNADQLGVLYVIWYRQIWFPATGWKAYSSAQGDPSSDHTNHVHLSLL
ncbi:coiled-coil domain-containing protein [Micromonospora sp. NPDC050397]|uniref:coiled-coil domain-containing protein n=1 Tax=Micromonospora sp. NPDC050397 TaxID=3364279 RepID=UPI00384A8D8C